MKSETANDYSHSNNNTHVTISFEAVKNKPIDESFGVVVDVVVDDAKNVTCMMTYLTPPTSLPCSLHVTVRKEACSVTPAIKSRERDVVAWGSLSVALVMLWSVP